MGTIRLSMPLPTMLIIVAGALVLGMVLGAWLTRRRRRSV